MNLQAITIVCLIAFVATSFDSITTYNKIFIVEQGSKINISGTSNLTSFSCRSEHTFDPKLFTYKMDDDGEFLYFFSAELDLNTSEIDCGGRAINKDLQKTLRSNQFPYIKIELRETQLSDQQDFNKNKSIPIKALTEITIAGCSQMVLIDVSAVDLGANRYRFSSKTDLKLSDFGLEAPKPMLGLIKVDDQLSIDFDLKIKISSN